MYVTRLDTWGIRKNCSKKRVSSLLHPKRDGDAMSTISKLGNADKGFDLQRIEKYLKRTNKDVEIPFAIDEHMIATTNVERGPHPLRVADSRSPNTGSISTDSLHSPFVQQCTYDKYEPNCLHRQWNNRFRLIEKFPKYNSHGKLTIYVANRFLVDRRMKQTLLDSIRTSL
jgi:hypothetical protein